MLRRVLTPLLIVGTACRDHVAPQVVPPKAVSITIAPTAVLAWMGDTVRFTATAHYADGSVKSDVTFRWVSSNGTAVMIDSTGLATVLARTSPQYPQTDTVSVGVSIDSVSTTATVTITQGAPVSVTPNPNYLMTGMTRQLLGWTYTSVGGPSIYVQTKPTSWTSSDPTVVSVDDTGVVTTRGPGTATIVAHFAVGGRNVAAATAFTVISPPSRRYSSVTGGLFSSRYGDMMNRECALGADDGGVYCWGVLVPNTEGFDSCRFAKPLSGTFTKPCSEIPVRLLSTPVFTAMSSGSLGGCALSTSQAVYCWGADWDAQIGDGTSDVWDDLGWIDHTPTPIASADQFRSVHAIGEQRCAIRVDGAAFCWGELKSGPGGDPRIAQYFTTTPIRVGPILWNTLANWSNGGNCGLAADSTAYCWAPDSVISPRQIDPSLRFAAIDANGSFACGLTSVGGTSCWTYSGVIQGPTQVTGGQALVFIGPRVLQPGGYMAETCGLTAAGDMYCVKQTGTAPNITFSLQPLNLGVKLKRFGGTCGIGLDDKAYCWDWSTLKVRLIPGQ